MTSGNTTIGEEKSISSMIPSDFHEIKSCGYSSSRRPSPILPLVDYDWYRVSDRSRDEVVVDAKCRDLAWVQCRLAWASLDSGQVVPAWTGFNKMVVSEASNASLVNVGYMPIIPAPADDIDTIFTVLNRCKYFSESLGQKNTVVTFDQALYGKAKEITWLKPEVIKYTIVRLGGFHIIMNFMKTIGQHVDAAGLKDVWVESEVFGENTAIHMLEGKAYNKTVRGHKLAVEALWQILRGEFLSWAENNNRQVRKEMKESTDTVLRGLQNRSMDGVEAAYSKLISLNDNTMSMHEEFEEHNLQRPQLQFWMNYMEMVSILFYFIRAEREGNWELHLVSFARMLPWFALYNHTNYARWGPVYLADMRQLATSTPEVYEHLQDGMLSVKRTDSKFSRVSVDQALEHVNKVSKVSGGIVGITRRSAARNKWCLTYNEKSRLAEPTYKMFGLHVDVDVDAE